MISTRQGQLRCVGDGIGSCRKLLLVRANSRPFQGDTTDTYRWCMACKKRSYRQSLLDAAADKRRRLEHVTAALVTSDGYAHHEEHVDEEMSTGDSSVMMETDTIEDQSTSDASSIDSSIRTRGRRHQVELDRLLESTLAHSRQHLVSHRWSIIRQPTHLRPIVDQWWIRCQESLRSLRNRDWSNLRIEGEGKSSQQRDTDTVRSVTKLAKETESMLTNLLKQLGVDDVDGKNCCALKLLRSPPGAQRQKLHWDTPLSKPLIKN